MNTGLNRECNATTGGVFTDCLCLRPYIVIHNAALCARIGAGARPSRARLSRARLSRARLSRTGLPRTGARFARTCARTRARRSPAG